MNSTIKSNKDIIQKYKLLVYKIANKIYKRDDGIEYDDLLQAGFEVLLKTYPQYNKDKGSIINYLTVVITRSIREEYNLQKNIISIFSIFSYIFFKHLTFCYFSYIFINSI